MNLKLEDIRTRQFIYLVWGETYYKHSLFYTYKGDDEIFAIYCKGPLDEGRAGFHIERISELFKMGEIRPVTPIVRIYNDWNEVYIPCENHVIGFSDLTVQITRAGGLFHYNRNDILSFIPVNQIKGMEYFTEEQVKSKAGTENYNSLYLLKT
jgi:hypothetical protein